ncbi:flavodoxin domain-containing protein, partial [Vibrio campbellii]
MYSSREGQTKKIMQRIASHLTECDAELIDLHQPLTVKLEDYDRILVGA